MEWKCTVLPALGFNSAKFDLISIKSCFLPILLNEWDIESTVIKKANQFISLKFGDLQLFKILNFRGGATSLDSFLKAYQTSETKTFLPYELFDHPDKMDKMKKTELPTYDAFYSKFRSCNPIEAGLNDYVNLFKRGMTREKTVVRLKRSKPLPTGVENSQYLQQIWNMQQMI